MAHTIDTVSVSQRVPEPRVRPAKEAARAFRLLSKIDTLCQRRGALVGKVAQHHAHAEPTNPSVNSSLVHCPSGMCRGISSHHLSGVPLHVRDLRFPKHPRCAFFWNIDVIH
jgi:hypothetical protein